jgi:hypothetical protein
MQRTKLVGESKSGAEEGRSVAERVGESDWDTEEGAAVDDMAVQM